MARELATLDRLSDGRVIVGAGAGWVVEEFTSTGVPFADRGGRLNECIRVLRHLWTQPEQPWHGKYYEIPAVGIVSPRTPGGPPIFVGGFLDPGLRRAARFGDGFIAVAQAPDAHASCTRLDGMRAHTAAPARFRTTRRRTRRPPRPRRRRWCARIPPGGRRCADPHHEAGVPDGFLQARDASAR
jgi:alkanesulfonate monooxygenase SsuD/methylene tetrahydromethanopterin reductase-like flavin-dependent oxidoreductase (luciferase family)